MKPATLAACGLLLALTPRAQAASDAPAGRRAFEDKAEAEPTAGQRLGGLAATLGPGLLIRGAGSYAIGRERVAGRLLFLEALGGGGTLAGLTGLALNGAATLTVAPLILAAAGGATLLASTFLLDGYSVLVPRQGLGRGARQQPLLRSSLGYARLVDPVLPYQHLVSQSLDGFAGRSHLAFRAQQTPTRGYSSHALTFGFRPWGQAGTGTEAPDGSYVELQTSGQRQTFAELGFSTDLAELVLKLRLDSDRVVPGLAGAFLEWDAGVAVRNTHFSGTTAVQTDSLLLGRHAVGIYLGEAMRGRASAEIALYYDHRHDGFAAGLKASGLGSGTAGHFGIKAEAWAPSGMGVSLYSEVGSAWITGVAVQYQIWGAQTGAPGPRSVAK